MRALKLSLAIASIFLAFGMNAQSGCTNATACNFDPAAISDDGSCELPIIFLPQTIGLPAAISCESPGGSYEPALSQSCAQSVIDNDPFCLENSWDTICEDAYQSCALFGCIDPQACNFDPAALTDDGTCTFPLIYLPFSVNGPALVSCTDPGPTYQLAESQSCASQVIDLDPFCVVTSWDALCQSAYEACLPSGCTDPLACNFDPDAILNDGGCQLPDGCTDPSACNFDPLATCDDGSCIIPPAPIVDDFTPQSLICQGGFVVSVVGSNFCGLQQVLFNGQPVVVQISGDSFLVFSSPPGTGTAEVVIQTSHGSTVFNISYAGPVINFTQLGELTCSGGQEVTLSGTGLCEATAVLFNGTPVAISNNTAQFIQFTAPPSIQSVASIQVVSDSGQSNVVQISFAQPQVTGVLPSILSCSGGELITISAEDLCAPFNIQQNGQFQPFNFNNGIITYVSPAGSGPTLVNILRDGNLLTSFELIYETAGCTDDTACNFNPSATCNDGSCTYAQSSCPSDLNNDGMVSTADLIIILSDFGSMCP